MNAQMKTSLTIAAALALAFGSQAVSAKGNAESGKAKAAQVCAASTALTATSQPARTSRSWPGSTWIT